jgi:glycolate oxidase
VEVDGPREGLDRVAGEVERLCRAQGAGEVRVARDEAERTALWLGRKRAAAAIGRISAVYCTQDVVVPRNRMPEMAKAIEEIERSSGLGIANLCHAGDGNMHPLVLFDDRVPEQVAAQKIATRAIVRKAVELGGTVTGEHGVGLEKSEFLPALYGDADLDLMMRVKRLFDPKGLANPGKVVPVGGWRAREAGGSHAR